MKRLPALSVLLASAAVICASAFFPLAAAPGEGPMAGVPAPAIAELRAHVQELEAHFRELLAHGREPEAREVRARLGAAQEELRELQMRARQAHPEAQEMRRKLAAMRGEIERLRDAGRLDEANRLAEAAHDLQREARERAEAAGDLRRERPPQEGPRPAVEELDRRLHHIQVAVENLHAAGLPELAERAAQAGEEMRRHLERARRSPGEPREPIRALQAQIEELHQAMREMREQFEQLRREHHP